VGAVHQEPGREKIEALPEQSITPPKSIGGLQAFAYDSAVSHSKGDGGNSLGASWNGQKSKIATNDIVEASQ